MADFGQPFWRPSLAKPTLASVSVLVVWPTLAKTDFGQNRLWPNRLWPNRVRLVFVCVCVFVRVCVCVCVAWVLVSRFRFGHVRNRPSGDRPSPWTALPLDRPKFRFFPLSRRKIRSFLPSLGVLSWNFGGVLKTKTLKCARLGSLGCRVKPRRLRGRRGFTRQPENSKRAHLSAPALQTPPKFHEKTPREGRRTNFAAGEGKKKREILGLPPFRPHFWPPPFRPPLFLGWGSHPSGPHPSGSHFIWVHGAPPSPPTHDNSTHTKKT